MNWLRQISKQFEDRRNRWKLTFVPDSPTSQSLAFALKKQCPSCKRTLNDHMFCTFAIAPFDGTDEVKKLMDSCENHEWEAVLKHQRFDAVLDDFIIKLIRCSDDQISMVAIYNPFELYESDSLYKQYLLTDDDMAKLRILAKDRQWMYFEKQRNKELSKAG